MATKFRDGKWKGCQTRQVLQNGPKAKPGRERINATIFTWPNT